MLSHPLHSKGRLKKQQMKQGREILRKEQDILGTLFPATPQRSQAAKRGRPVKKVTKRTTASATRIVNSPPPQSVTTPRRRNPII